MLNVTIKHNKNDRLLQEIETMLHKDAHLDSGIIKDLMSDSNSTKLWWELTFQVRKEKLNFIEDRITWLEKVWKITLAYTPVITQKDLSKNDLSKNA